MKRLISLVLVTVLLTAVIGSMPVFARTDAGYPSSIFENFENGISDSISLNNAAIELSYGGCKSNKCALVSVKKNQGAALFPIKLEYGK